MLKPLKKVPGIGDIRNGRCLSNFKTQLARINGRLIQRQFQKAQKVLASDRLPGQVNVSGIKTFQLLRMPRQHFKARPDYPAVDISCHLIALCSGKKQAR